MEDETAGPASLGEWHCDAGLWSDFKASEAQPYFGSVRAGRDLMLGGAIATIIVLALLSLAAYFGYLATLTCIEVGSVSAVIGGVLMFSGLIVWLYRRSNEASINTETGEIVIAIDGISVNGRRYEWNFGGDKNVWLVGCERRTVDGRLGTSFEILVFLCEGIIRNLGPTGGGTMPVTVERRVPVPLAYIPNADRIVERLNLRVRCAGS